MGGLSGVIGDVTGLLSPRQGGYQPPPLGFSGGGLTGNQTPSGFKVTASPGRTSLVSDIGSAYGTQADYWKNLASTLTPGFGALTQRLSSANQALTTSALNTLENSRQAAIGNLRENLNQRRISGSSFGEDSLTRAEAEFSKQKQDVLAQQQANEANIQANSYLQELNATNQIMQQSFTASQNALASSLNEMNLEAGLASQLGAQSYNTLSQNAQFTKELSMLDIQSRNQLYGDLAYNIGTMIPTGGSTGVPTSLGSFTPQSSNIGAGTLYGSP